MEVSKIKRKNYRTIILIIILTFSSVIFPFFSLFRNNNRKFQEMSYENILQYSGETVYNEEWLDNNNFSTQDEWFYSKGAQGDNSTVDANISNDQANYKIIGDNNTFDVLAGEVNSSTWSGWGIYNNSDYLLPDVYDINATGLYVYHYLDENEGGGAGQVHNFPSIHFRKNVSLPEDMSDYEFTSASLEVIFNASVNSNVDTYGDLVGQPLNPDEGIFDSATFYIEIADLNLSYSFRVGENKTTDLGQDSPSILNITDRELTYVSENDLITALNLALEKDPSHSNFTIILGMDIYCEDNDFPDYDEWNALIFKSFNLTFSYQKKVDKFSSVSWNQEGNQITGSNVQVTEANLRFKYNITPDWPETLSPYSEIKILINNNPHPETVRLSSANTSLQDAKVGGFDVTNLILKNVNITVSIQVFIANTFELGSNITISIDDVYLNITYAETFSDDKTQAQLLLNSENKTADPYIELPITNNLNITIKYIDNQSLNHITNALVQLEGKESGDLVENSTFGQYTIIINTSKLDIGLWLLGVIAQKNNYSTQTISFYVKVIERPTEFKVFVDSEEKTINNTVKIKSNEFMNITVLYKDNSSKQHLSGANVSILGIGNLVELNNQYNLTLNSNTLGLGFHVLTINSQTQNYTTQTFQLFVEVFERATELRLFVNGTQRFDNDIISVEVFDYINLTVFYLDDSLQTYLNSAEITLLSLGNFSEIGNQYNYTLNSLNLNLGFNVLTISAQFNNYETQTIQFYIEVIEMESEIQLFIDSNPVNASDTIQTEANQFLNITIFYIDNITKLNLPGALVEIIGRGNFSEISSQYNYTMDTNDLEQGITILTVQAQLTNYKSQTIQFYVKVIERNTELQLYINSIQRNASDTIDVEVNQFLNITIFYIDNTTKLNLPGSIVELIGRGNFSESSGQYNYTIDTNDLEQGITIMTVQAQQTNYKSQIIRLYINVIERNSSIQLYLNGEDKTFDPVIELPIGSSLNIVVKFTDNTTGFHIYNASVSIEGSSILLNFTENIGLEQYSYNINTTLLKVGVNLLKLTAYKPNYKIQEINLRITINKISTIIRTELGDPYIITGSGQNINLRIVLNDTDFGGTIKGAIVTYIWAYGQGNLTDSDNDGIYEANIEGVPIGTYIITITASGYENYDFESYTITISVTEEGSSGELTWLIYALIGVIVGVVGVFSVYQLHFKYPPIVRKVRKLRKKIRKGKKINPIITAKRKEIIETNLKDKSSVIDFEPEFDKIKKNK